MLSAILEDRSPQKQSNGSSAPVSYCYGLVRSSVRSEPPSSSDQVSGARFRCSPVEKFNDQEMDDRTLKVEIAKSGGAGGKDGVPQQRRAQRSLLHMEKWSSELDDAVLACLTEPGGRSPGEIGRRLGGSIRGRCDVPNLELSSWCFGPDDRPGG